MLTEPVQTAVSEQMQMHTKRVAWLDVLRIIAILCIIAGHMGPPKNCFPFVHWILGSFYLPVYFFFFASALFLKNDCKKLLKRALFLYGAFIVWGIFFYFLLPYIDMYTAMIKGQDNLLVRNGTLWEYLMPGITVKGPGHLWFLRALAIMTFFSPLLLKLRVRYLCCLVLLLCGWEVFMESLPDAGAGYNKVLPFLLQQGVGNASLISFVLGIIALRMGGIRAVTRLSKMPIAILVFIALLPLGLVFIPPAHQWVQTSDGLCIFLQTGALLALGLLIHRLTVFFSGDSLFNRGIRWVAGLAPCVFFIYVFHRFHPMVNACCSQTEGTLPVLLYRSLQTVSPVLVFAICATLYLPLSRIPYVSKVLCMTSTPKPHK